jgi:exonuclease VII small subunit
MMACFGPEIAADKLERGDRFLEEALELLQSGDYPRERIAALVDYTYGREKGEPLQEVGGVMITLAAYCLAHGLDMHEAGEKELARIWTKVDKIRAKQAAKPTGSALPVARAALDASK